MTDEQNTSEVNVAALLQQWIDEGRIDTEKNEYDDFILFLHNEHGLPFAKAMRLVSQAKKDTGLVTPRTTHKREDVKAFLEEKMAELGEEVSRAALIEALQEQFGYTKNSAASTLSSFAKELGLASEVSRTNRPLEEVVAWIRGHANMKRKEFSQAMARDLGYSEVTAGAFYTYLPAMKEYARQEVEGIPMDFGDNSEAA